ncbi:hypothetical protein C9439_05065 [archaeon SCG-AAA382B04]|nr:hypothetical protein C9439_05065 [archaeon SCG-AAA382B04]
MKCYAVVRADNRSKLETALSDLEEHANLEIPETPKKIEARKADEILVEVLDSPLEQKCNDAAVCKLKEDPASVINTIKGIHPPAHVVVVSERHDVFDVLNEDYGDLEALNT